MPDLNAVFSLVGERRFDDAQVLLDACPGRRDSPAWWQMQGLIHSAQGRSELAVRALTQGLRFSATDLRTAGRLHFELGVLFGKDGHREEALQAYLQSRILLRQKSDPLRRLALSHNLAWSLLESDRLEEASECLDESVLAAVRMKGPSYHSLVQCGRSLVARLRGDQHLALSRAALARETAPSAFVAARARYLEGHAHWRLGNLDAATQAFEVARDLTPEYSAVQLIDLSLSLLQKKAPHDETGFTIQQRARIRFHQAAWHLRAGDHHKAVGNLEEALAVLPAYELKSESSLVPDLVLWGQTCGYALPDLPPPSLRMITIRVRNPLELRVNGHLVKARVPKEVAALVADLATEPGGMTRWLLAQDALGEHADRLELAIDQLRALIGDADAVGSPTDMGDQLRLSPAWTWVIDSSGRGTVLGNLSSAFASRLECDLMEPG